VEETEVPGEDHDRDRMESIIVNIRKFDQIHAGTIADETDRKITRSI
jgi:hypothetical protein